MVTLPFYSNIEKQEDSKETLGQTKPKASRCTWHSVILSYSVGLGPTLQSSAAHSLSLKMALLVAWSFSCQTLMFWHLRSLGCDPGVHCLASLKSLYKYTLCPSTAPVWHQVLLSASEVTRPKWTIAPAATECLSGTPITVPFHVSLISCPFWEWSLATDFLLSQCKVPAFVRGANLFNNCRCLHIHLLCQKF